MGYALTIKTKTPAEAQRVLQWLEKNALTLTSIGEESDPCLCLDSVYSPAPGRSPGYHFSCLSDLGNNYLWRLLSLVSEHLGLKGVYLDDKFAPNKDIPQTPFAPRATSNKIQKTLWKCLYGANSKKAEKALKEVAERLKTL